MASSALKSVICGHLVVAKLDLVEVCLTTEKQKGHAKSSTLHKKMRVHFDYVFCRPQTQVDSNSSVSDAVDLMQRHVRSILCLFELFYMYYPLFFWNRHNIQSVPVYDRTTKGYIGVYGAACFLDTTLRDAFTTSAVLVIT